MIEESQETSKKRLLIVDDEPGIRDSLRLLLKASYSIATAQDGDEALKLFDEVQPDLVLLDVLMPRLGGLDTLKALRAKKSDVPVIILTATNTVKTAVQAMKIGAVDYLNKPFDVEELTCVIGQALQVRPEHPESQQQIDFRAEKVARPELEADFGPMVGKSAVMTELFQSVAQIAQRDATVLISGESGTGKELIARRIHQLSTRKSGPFIAVNCAAIPESLIESELFGHEKGAFTHAVERRVGLCEMAHGGTLFLDEIGELSLTVQVKLLRFLQGQEFHRVGRSKPISVDVRIITATNKDLEALVEQQRFRQDLYYRINVINLCLPPLRDRFDDIPALVENFCRKFSGSYGGRKVSFSDEAMRTMVTYDWPGNVRELENVIESLMALAPNDLIEADDLPRKLKNLENREPMKASSMDRDMNFQEAERTFETEMILKALRKTNFVQTRAADLLGISRRILKYKMDKLGISDSGEVAAEPSGNSQITEG